MQHNDSLGASGRRQGLSITGVYWILLTRGPCWMHAKGGLDKVASKSMQTQTDAREDPEGSCYKILSPITSFCSIKAKTDT
jgi:hypothetical protein